MGIFRSLQKLWVVILVSSVSLTGAVQASTHGELVALFKEWRQLETPTLLNGAPDYTAAVMTQRHQKVMALRDKLMAMDIESWPVADQADWHVVRAEMNGFDFNHRVLKPWVRDPAFYNSIWTYKSDVPAHEGPTHHAVVELWTYEFPLSADEQARLTKELAVIPPLNDQAKVNLTGNARELWIAGIRDIREQYDILKGLQEDVRDYGNDALNVAITAAMTSTENLISWLEVEGQKKTGPSGIGKENYTWYQQNVHLVPMTWDQEVTLLKRELDRAWSSLKLEEHRNRDLPPLQSADTPEDFEKLTDAAVDKLLTFLDVKEVVTVPDYFRPALEAKKGSFVPKDKRNFFYIGMHYDPLPLYSHFYHWFELARMEYEPHERDIRRGSVLYNIFDSRNEGTATGVEEIFMHAGLYDDNPRGREIVYIMLAQRAARGLGSLYAHANMMTMEEAGEIHMNYTPRGWMKTEKDLLIFEQHLYLRQPGYGTSYITGKYLLERAMADYARIKEENNEVFRLKDFFDELNSIGGIPVSLGRWQMTGVKDDINSIFP